jgi:hypothetical protein
MNNTEAIVAALTGGVGWAVAVGLLAYRWPFRGR